MPKERLTFRMSKYWTNKMEKIIKQKKFDSKSDFLRAAVQDFIRKEQKMQEPTTTRGGETKELENKENLEE